MGFEELANGILGGQFHSKQIGAIINLQEPGEHTGCGDGVRPESGFSYNPNLFTQENS
jgi:hypothetical protein